MLRSVGVGLMAELIRQSVEVDVDEEIVDCFSSHLCNEFVWIVVVEKLIFFGQIVDDVEILFFGEKIKFLDSFDVAGIYDDVAFIVDDCIEFL